MNLQYGEIAKIWRAGCIIRARFLQNITNAYDRDPNLANLLLDDYFNDISKNINNLFEISSLYQFKRVYPFPHFLPQFLIMILIVPERLPANIIQAQRDYFGAHTYERVDKAGTYHFDWYGENGEEDWS